MFNFDDIPDEMIEKLRGYTRVNDITEVPLQTHLQYLIKNRESVVLQQGFLSGKIFAENFITLTNGISTWSVQVKNKFFFKKMSRKEEIELTELQHKEYHNIVKKDQIIDNLPKCIDKHPCNAKSDGNYIKFKSSFEPLNVLLLELQGDCSNLDNVQRYFILETKKKISSGCCVFNSESHRAIVVIKQLKNIYELFNGTQISVDIEIIDPKIMFVIRKMYEFYDYTVSVVDNKITISYKD